MTGKRVYALFCFVGSVVGTFGSPARASSELRNANHIVNAIHSSMRQWGSSLKHNGVSFFLATIPEGTLLYHGSPHSEPINGTEFLAFDPEHAMVFARSGSPPGKQHDARPPHHQAAVAGSLEIPLQLTEEHSKWNSAGWLHTYATSKELKLLYVDGMSAAKSQIGTLDSLDIILLNGTLKEGGVSQEYPRAQAICNMAREKWDGRIDGLIRMAAGFEIILCAFDKNLSPVRITRTRSDHRNIAPRPPKKGNKPAGLLKLVSDRYDGIGGGRVVVNYDEFVTAYTYGLDLFTNDSSLPRVRHLPSELLEPIRRDIDAVVMSREPANVSINWQAYVDMLVQRYAHDLRYLASGSLPTEAFYAYVERLLEPFVDFDSRDEVLELERCSTQFIPAGAQNNSIAFRAVFHVTKRICSTLKSVADDGKVDHRITKKRIEDLMAYLDWSTWKECRGCRDHEFCAVAIWPSGTIEDHEHPVCRDLDSGWREGPSYWGPVWH